MINIKVNYDDYECLFVRIPLYFIDMSVYSKLYEILYQLGTSYYCVYRYLPYII